MNRSQRKLLAGLLPFAAVLVLFMLPTKSWDSRPFYLGTFFGVLLLCYFEVLLFDLENNLRRLGKSFAIAFPVAVFVVAFLIATSPRIVTYPASWDPRAPRADEAASSGENEMSRPGDSIRQALDRARNGTAFEPITRPRESNKQIGRAHV